MHAIQSADAGTVEEHSEQYHTDSGCDRTHSGEPGGSEDCLPTETLEVAALVTDAG